MSSTDSASVRGDAFWNRVRFRQTVRDLALLFAAAGAITLLAALLGFIRAQATGAWPTAPGVVVVSGVETAPVAGRIVRFEPVVVIEYRYEVAGQTYTSRAVSQERAPVSAGTPEAERLLATYPINEPVTVFYNPNDPAQALLEQALPAGTFTTAAVLFGAAAVLALVAWLFRP